MPATAGRVRMPANNRVHSSAALQTHGIWQSAIGYDPYAPTNKDDNTKKSATTVAAAEPEGENAYASFQGLLQLAKITNSVSDEARGACKKCGRVGHLTFQCRNFLSVKDEVKKGGKDDDLLREVVLEKLKGEKVKLNGNIKDKVEGGESSEEEEEESEISDSEYDSEIERIIAKKYGKKSDGKRKLSSGRKDDDEEEDDEDEEEEGKKRKKRGRSKKRSSRKMESSDSEDADEGGRGRKRKNKRKEKRCRRDDYSSSSSDDGEDRRRKRKTRQEKRRRRSHRHSSEDYSEESPERGHTNKRRSRRLSSPSDSDVSVSDDSRIGRYKKRDDKNSRKRHREREN